MSYTFTDVNSDHTIQAVFEERTPTPTGDYMRMFIKQNGVWVPLFEEV